MVKNSSANAGDTVSTLGLGRSPGEGNGHQYACLGNPVDRGAWGGGLQSMEPQESDAI